MSLFDGLARQRRFVYLVVTLLTAAGIGAAFNLPSSIYPELNFPRITIVAQGTSLGARQQMFSVTRPIEEAVSVVPGVQRVRSRTIRGASEISLYFAPGTDMVVALQLTESRVNQTRGELPGGVEIETERMLPSLFPILTYNVVGSDPGGPLRPRPLPDPSRAGQRAGRGARGRAGLRHPGVRGGGRSRTPRRRRPLLR